MKKVAICLKGAVGKKGSPHDRFLHKNDVYKQGEYIDYVAVKNAIFQHIVNANPGYEFDFFLHGWNLDLESELVDLYKPKKSLFEDNNIYNEEISSMIPDPSDFGGVSGGLSLKKSLQLREDYELENDMKYDIVIVYRYDVLLWKNMILEYYDVNNWMFVNSWNGSRLADYHFVMTSEVAKGFKYLYDSVVTHNNQHKFHHWIYNYIVNIMRCNLREDDIKAGIDQEHMRLLTPDSNLSHVLTNFL